MRVITKICSAGLIALALLGCKREIEDRPVFPTAEYVSPSVIQNTSQNLTIYGTGLEGATVTIGGVAATQISVTQDKDNGKGVMVVDVPASLGTGTHAVVITFSDDDKTQVTLSKGVTVDPTETFLQADMLVADFDWHGVRSAGETQDFSNGSWSGNPGANSSMGIASSYENISPSPAGGNFVYMTVGGGGILPNTYGYVAALESRNEIQDDFETSWPEGFTVYPNSSIEFVDGFDAVSDYYLNFYVNFNKMERGQLRVYLGNSEISNAQKFAKTITINNLQNDSTWSFYSIPFSQFKCNFGFGGGGSADVPCTINDSYINKINQINFTVSDNYNNNYSSCCRGTTLDCCDEAIVDPVEIFIDHVTISKGGEGYDFSN